MGGACWEKVRVWRAACREVGHLGVPCVRFPVMGPGDPCREVNVCAKGLRTGWAGSSWSIISDSEHTLS
jgi:hypothetical protein